jgi:hypothetical protein
VDPVYLPANRGIVFSSNRQAKSRLNQALGRSYFAADEYEREAGAEPAHHGLPTAAACSRSASTRATNATR